MEISEPELAEVRGQQAEILKSLKSVTDDHERRLRFLERTIGYGLGFLGAVKIIADYLLSR